MTETLIPFPFTQQTFCRYEPVEQRIDRARVLVVDSLLRDERDVSPVAYDDWGDMLPSQLKRERFIAGLAIEYHAAREILARSAAMTRPPLSPLVMITQP